ncbi:MAG: glutamate--tRNA ligase [Bdellovibrionales bacterium RBG_16_40_8]|nr:MAG: glutamate--tRNA ligase [Bdellovibrionales bacterium RBG_16_40_8]
MVRTRFAPSPTGYLHVGGARTALYSYLYARKHNGKFVLRVEDTDEERSSEEFLRLQLSDLKWLGYISDEGVEADTLKDIGPYGPYRQSERLSIYREHADKLLKEGRAYYCFLTDVEIDLQRKEAQRMGRPPQVSSPYRELPLKEAEKKLSNGEKAVVRFKVPDLTREFSFVDLVRGEVKFPSDMVGDFVCLRSGGMPVYNFCCVIDDALMKITHVLRAEEHLSNTLRQMMLYEAFGYELPQFGHLSIILGSDRQKLSKRHGATSVKEYRENGYLPEAITNFIALLGWSSPNAQEILSQKELVEQFSTERLNSAAAVFDEAKLKWMNAQYLRALPHQELWARLEPFFARAGLKLPQDPAWQDRSLSVYKTSIETLVDAIEHYRPLSQDAFIVYEEANEVLKWPTTKIVIEEWKRQLASQSDQYISEAQFLTVQDTVKNICKAKGKELFMPIRVAIVGKPHGAELKILVPLIEKKTLIERADIVLSKI